jgi:hypothetical protein
MGDNLGISEVEAIDGYIAARKRLQQLAHEEKGKFVA